MSLCSLSHQSRDKSGYSREQAEEDKSCRQYSDLRKCSFYDRADIKTCRLLKYEKIVAYRRRDHPYLYAQCGNDSEPDRIKAQLA